jgi:hypothetical protein
MSARIASCTPIDRDHVLVLAGGEQRTLDAVPRVGHSAGICDRADTLANSIDLVAGDRRCDHREVVDSWCIRSSLIDVRIGRLRTDRLCCAEVCIRVRVWFHWCLSPSSLLSVFQYP